MGRPQTTAASVIASREANEFLEYHLDGGTFDGRFCLGCQPSDGGAWLQVRADTADKVANWPSMTQRRKAYYVTANQISGVVRDGSALFALCNLVVDLDCHTDTMTASPDEVWQLLQRDGDYPEPTGVVWTGRGLQLWWHIEAVSVKCRKVYTEALEGLENAIQAILDDYPHTAAGWTVDRATGATLVGWKRFPGSYNYHTGRYGDFEVLHTDTYTLTDLLEALGPLQAPKAKAVYIETPLMVQAAGENRLQRLAAWAEGRQWSIIGHRNTFLCICGSLLVAADPQNARKRLEDINAKLVPPMSAAEVITVFRGCTKARYRWRNSTIAKRLGMTDQEMADFGASGAPGPVLTRASAYKLAQQTGKDTRKQNRTRDEARAKAKADKLAALKEAKAQGMKKAQVARLLGVSRPWVDKYWEMDN